MAALTLRDYQIECLDAIKNSRESGIDRPLVSLPTGSGKTVIFCEEAKRTDGRSLILVHRDELLEQALEKLYVIWPEAEPGVVKADRNEIDARVIVASIQTLSQRRRLEQLGKEFGFLATDEAHHAAATSYLRVYEHLELPRKDLLSLGVTATPFRSDEKALEEAFDQVVYKKTISEMIMDGYLCDLRALRVKTSIDLDNIQTFGDDFYERDLADAINTVNRNRLIVESYLNYGEDRLALCFTANVKHAEDLAEAFRNNGVDSTSISGEMPYHERKSTLRKFHNQEIKVLCNCQLLTEGFDEPAIDCIILARPTKSPVMYTQMIGRGTRTFPGKADCLIIDIADVSRRHKLDHLPDLLGREIPYDASKSVLDVLKKEERFMPTGPPVELVGAEPVDLFRRSRYIWKQTEKDVFYLDLGPYGRVGVFYRNGGWNVGYRSQDRTIKEITRRDVPLSWAFGIAENIAEEKTRGELGLIIKNARWRMDPATRKQLDTLDRYGIVYSPNITKGEASDSISRVFDKRYRN
ncbi:MAG: DEAD/DEAH box helicase [Candidatus Aenigmarchaeota archaeon]|nr:DEAD/DEAH box helicase [Candidatus Aenigmarchaeota archaeon]